MEKPDVSLRHLAFLDLSRVCFYPLWHNYPQVLMPGTGQADGDQVHLRR